MANNQACPHCEHGFSLWFFVGFLRLGSITCPGCRGLVTLDRKGWRIWRASFLTVFVLAVVAGANHAPDLALFILVLGFFTALLATARHGTLVPSPES